MKRSGRESLNEVAETMIRENLITQKETMTTLCAMQSKYI